MLCAGPMWGGVGGGVVEKGQEDLNTYKNKQNFNKFKLFLNILISEQACIVHNCIVQTNSYKFTQDNLISAQLYCPIITYISIISIFPYDHKKHYLNIHNTWPYMIIHNHT